MRHFKIINSLVYTRFDYRTRNPMHFTFTFERTKKPIDCKACCEKRRMLARESYSCCHVMDNVLFINELFFFHLGYDA